MASYTLSEATDRAIAAGATIADIHSEAARQARHVGSVPFRNMIVALGLMPWRNDRGDWTRLAGALLARKQARR